MKWRNGRSVERVVEQVKDAAAPHLDLLRKLQEEQRRIDAQIEREIRLIQNV